MRKKSSKAEFVALFLFLLGTTLVLTNGFSSRIFAQDSDRALYDQVEPLGDVLAEILQNYVYEPDLDRAVEGALMGIMSSLDRNSSYIPAESFQAMREDTEGEFDGIGVHIRFDEEKNGILVFQPVPDAPAAKAGIQSGDLIVEVDGVSTDTILEDSASGNEALSKVSQRIKGPRGTEVNIGVSRARNGSDTERDVFRYDVKRGKIPLQSIVEARLINGDVGYVRISDFKKNTAEDLKKKIKEFEKENMRAMILDLRWNPGGLLNASREVCELFLPKGSLVTSTRGRKQAEGRYLEDMVLTTQKHPVLPITMPIIVLVSSGSASSSEIVTGGLQFHQRALVIGEQTYGKGSVQTIIPLNRPEGAALRLTTALYYTPAEVTIDLIGISPDIDVPMDIDTQIALQRQMIRSLDDGPEFINNQNHGEVTGNMAEDAVQDIVLDKALEVLNEESVFEKLLLKYHRDIHDTQKMASQDAIDKKVK